MQNIAMPPTNNPVNGELKACNTPPSPHSLRAHNAVSRWMANWRSEMGVDSNIGSITGFARRRGERVRLSEILKSIEPIRLYSASGVPSDADTPDPEIGSIHYRSQEVKAGGMFVAMSGSAADGHDFINDALNHGAGAIVAQKEYDPDLSGGGQAEKNHSHLKG